MTDLLTDSKIDQHQLEHSAQFKMEVLNLSSMKVMHNDMKHVMLL